MTGTIGLLLAAGAGRRMGMPKALVMGADDVPWVLRSVRTLTAGGCPTPVVVIGAAAQNVRPLLAMEDVTIVEATDWEEGMGASLRAGLNAIAHSDADAALVHLVDLPDVGPAVIRRLAAYAAPGILARAQYGRGPGRAPGHPVLLGRDHWAAIAARASGDSGARAYLAEHDVVDVDCSDLATGADVDTRTRARTDPGAITVDPPTFVPKLGQ